jgi:bifunctional non-homologous end joining protein LigD
MLWRVSRPIRSGSKPPGFILPCQPALADRPPAGPGWLHEIKFDGYRVIARRDGEQIRLWARTTSDYSRAFTRIRDTLAALPGPLPASGGHLPGVGRLAHASSSPNSLRDLVHRRCASGPSSVAVSVLITIGSNLLRRREPTFLGLVIILRADKPAFQWPQGQNTKGKQANIF